MVTMGTNTSPVADDLVDAIEVARHSPATDVGALSADLYTGWYVNPTNTGSEPVSPGADLVGAYVAAHAATYRWSPGWTVRRVSSRGRVLVERDESTRVMDRIDVLPDDRRCLPPRIGDVVAVCERFDTVGADGQIWMTYGPGWEPGRMPSDCVRLYWNVAADTAPRLVATVTEHLADASYGLKLPATTDGFDRSDSAVVYVSGADLAALAPRLVAVWELLGPSLRPSTPRFTRRLGRGWSAAHDPDTGESFGERCSRCVATAIIAASGRRHDLAVAEIDPVQVAAELGTIGIDPRRPWARDGSDANLDILDPGQSN